LMAQLVGMVFLSNSGLADDHETINSTRAD